MINITIPDNNTPERIYIIDIFFKEFLGLDYIVELSSKTKDYILKFDDAVIIIKDDFFSKYPSPLSYLNKTALPDVHWLKESHFLTEDNLPILYGDSNVTFQNNTIRCGIDIFASSFFMLTRWEETVEKLRDTYGRYPANKSTACKNNFLNRPIVNEYVEFLWNMLKKLGYNGKRKERFFDIKLTHDVDFVYNPYKNLMGDLIKRKKPSLFLKKISHFMKTKLHNPFSFFMDLSEKNNTTSYFYLMSTDSGMRYDTDYYLNSKLFKNRLSEIKKRGHAVGFHPGYYTHEDPKTWRAEKDVLEHVLQAEVTEGRQHYLRMNMNKTLSIWEDNDMSTDLTLGYAQKEGFRCGTGDAFSVFDFTKRKKYRLKEQPLIIMDNTLQFYQNYTPEQAKSVIQDFIYIGKKYKTCITFLFHPMIFFDDWIGYDEVYRSIFTKS